MNGRLMSGSHTESGMLVTLASSMEMPVTPPSMRLLDNRKPCSPMVAHRIPSTISSTFRSSGQTCFIRRS
jgi:hypothetical protein